MGEGYRDRRWLVAVVSALILGGCTSGSGGAGSIGSDVADSSPLRIEALSTRPEYVTGGDVLVAVRAGDQDLGDIVVEVDGRDVTAAFASDGDQLVGLVTGLPEGDSTIRAARGRDLAELVVTNHPTTGPLFSGPLLEPFVCTTEQNGLGPATDAACSAPAQVAQEEIDGVATIVERGVLGRSAYTIAIPRESWNRRLVYRFGGGCGSTYSQGRSLVEATDPSLLSRGYAVVTSSLNTFQNLCNSVVSAEVALMVKEHFIERYGLPRFTIGEGGSGGAIQQLQIAQNYPGILDALAPTVPFPDAASIAPGVTDCGLLDHYYRTAEGARLSDTQRAAINGHRTTGTCDLWVNAFLQLLDPTRGCSAELDPSRIYDPERNPGGVRCTFQDSNVNIYGRDPVTGFARRPLDNTGVQYGLEALRGGVITVDQFLDLNEHIGGYDIDGRIVPRRMAATEEDMRVAYATGQVLSGQGLWDVPIILTNVYTDDQGDIHDRQRLFAIRERLRGPDGALDPNLVLWTVPGTGALAQTLIGAVKQGADAVGVLDEWLTRAGADTSERSWSEKLAANRPAAAVDSCVLPDGERLSGAGVNDEDNPCTRAYPVKGDPRRAAGAPLVNDIGKCRLVPVDPGLYGVELSNLQRRRLEAIFPDGVCDWSHPGVGQVAIDGTWLRFG
ncbi:DUF6351 family protein [Rhabdothermincola sp.]|uniref:DUF6351 family protein n=1 Tax=Rhabdothermincola sp. TaxID=2820405 RepID=UPI002FE0074C